MITAEQANKEFLKNQSNLTFEAIINDIESDIHSTNKWYMHKHTLFQFRGYHSKELRKKVIKYLKVNGYKVKHSFLVPDFIEIYW